MKIEVVTPPTETPVTVSELKQQARVSDSSEDELLQSYIDAATDYLQDQTGMFFLNHSVIFYPVETAVQGVFSSGAWRREFDSVASWSAATAQFPRSPVSYVSSVEYRAVGSSGYTVISSSDYSLLADRRLRFGSDFSFPAISHEFADPVRISATVGYGTTPGSVPAILRNAILILAAHFYDNRGGSVLPRCVDQIIANHRTVLL